MPFALGIYSLLPHLPTACINPSFLVPTHLHPSCIPPSADPPAVLWDREHAGYVTFPWSSKPRSATEARRPPSIGIYRIKRSPHIPPSTPSLQSGLTGLPAYIFLVAEGCGSCIFLLWLSGGLGSVKGCREDLPTSRQRAAEYGEHGMGTSFQQSRLHVMHQDLTYAGGLVGWMEGLRLY